MAKQWVLSRIERLPVRYHSLARQFVKFGVTGVIGAIVDFSVYAFLTRAVGWTTLYTVWGYEISAANNVSVLLAIMSNFLLNKYWTFRQLEGSFARQGAGYFGLNFITWALNQILMSYFAFRVVFFEDVFGNSKDFAAKVAAIGIILFINFFGSKLVIFRKREVGGTPSLSQ